MTTKNFDSDLIFEDWGLIDYEQSLQKQLDLVEQVHGTQEPGYLIFCTHPPVVTLGRATKPGDVFGWQGSIVEISRGGRATYHGPSQLVVYVIMNLSHPRKNRKEREIAGFLRIFEDCIVRVLADLGIQAVGKSLQKNPNTDSETDETGVWVGPRKIASLGLGVKKWITYHGAAINLIKDPTAFTGMKPCGFTTETMLSVEEQLGKPVDSESFKSRLKTLLLERV